MKICDRDGCENETDNPRFCSQECVYQRGPQPQLRKQTPARICAFPGCSNILSGGSTFCSRSCSNLHRHGAKDKSGKAIIKTCAVCGKDWETRCSDPRHQRRTCSDECEFEARGRVHRGKVLSEETRQKLSDQRRGRKLSHSHRAAIGRGITGSKNSHWIDGRSRHKEGAADYNFEFTGALKTTVKNRDGNRCRSCGGDGSQYKMGLHVHHIDCDKTNNTINNLVTLCASCHTRVHSGTLDITF
jgi:hypothetical protein